MKVDCDASIFTVKYCSFSSLKRQVNILWMAAQKFWTNRLFNKYAVDPRLSGHQLSGLFNYPDILSGPIFWWILMSFTLKNLGSKKLYFKSGKVCLKQHNTCSAFKRLSAPWQKAFWYNQLNSGPLLQEKAKHFSLKVHVNGQSADHKIFKTLAVWLDKFKIGMAYYLEVHTCTFSHWNRLLELKMWYMCFYFFCSYCCLINILIF